MRIRIAAVALTLVWFPVAAWAQAPSATTSAPQQRTAGQPATSGQPPAQRGGGRPRGIQVMTLSTSAWMDGAMIPAKHTQVGGEVSPPLAWTNVPEGTSGFVLIVHDVDAAVAPGTDDTLHWLVWDIPATATSLAEGVAHGPQLPDGSRQISTTGPFYRGPGAAAAGPAHHYVFELYAVDAPIDVPAVGASPAQTRAAVLAAMSGHVRGKGAYVGLFKRQ